MKRISLFLIVLFVVSISITGIAATKQAVKKSSRGLEGTVSTRIGSLEFISGYPSDATIKKLYNELDFQRAVQVYLWALPLVEMAEWQKAQKDIFKAGTNDLLPTLTRISIPILNWMSVHPGSMKRSVSQTV